MRNFTFTLLCFVFALPLAAQPSIRILSIDSANMGGFHKFRFPVEDSNRLREAFGGHELRIEFKPVWKIGVVFQNSAGKWYGNYGREIVITDNTLHEVVAHDTIFPAGMYEHAALFLGGNNFTGIGHPESRQKMLRTGAVTLKHPVQDAFGFAFDYALQQWGGAYRADTVYIRTGSANTFVAKTISGFQTIGFDTVNNRLVPRSYNNGPAVYDVEFLPGGMETMSLKYGSLTSSTVTVVDVPYLNVRVTSGTSYKLPLPNSDSITVRYPDEVRHATVIKDLYNLQGKGPWPTARDVPIGQYNLTAYAWVNGRKSDGFRDRPNQAAVPSDAPLSSNTGVPVGTQGRYYLSAANSKGDTVDFVHVFLASGTEFGLDYANKGGRSAPSRFWKKLATQPTKDFQAGDQVHFSTFGGALGFPMPSASIVVRVDTTTTGVPQTDDLQLAVAVSPHPFSNTATMQYTLPHPTNVTLTIFDQLGTRVHTLVDNKQEAGKHTVTLGEPRLQRGMYMYRLQAGQQVVYGTFLVVP